jgi:hypothetical protein
MFMQELFLSWTQPSKTSCLFTIYQLYVLDWKRNILNLSMVMRWLMKMIDGWLTPLSTIYRRGQFYWRRKPEDPEKTTDLSQVTDILYHIILLYTSPWSRFEHTTSVVIDTDYLGSCKSNYHTITATTAPLNWSAGIRSLNKRHNWYATNWLWDIDSYLRNKSWKPECVLTWIGEY